MNFPVYTASSCGLVSAYDRARQVYAKELCARTLDHDILLHVMHGYAICRPDLLLLGRPVNREAGREAIVDPSVEHESPDCWHIYLAVGDIREFFKFEPFSLGYYSWERNNELYVFKSEQVRRICLRQ